MKYRQVYSRVVDLIENGTFRMDGRIPSVRDMSKQMNFSMMTVLEGYYRLVEDGILENREKSGFYVLSAGRKAECDCRLPRPDLEKINLFSSNIGIDDNYRKLLESSRNPQYMRLGAGSPSPEFFPSRELAAHMSRAARYDFNKMNRSILDHGEEGLRKSVSKFMTSGGTDVSPRNILITSGATQALMLALKAVAGHGDTIAVESPGYYGNFYMLSFLNLKVVEIPMCPVTGISIEELEKTLKKKKISALIVSPSFQNPTGALMPLSSRKMLCGLARKHGFALIEDDVFGYLSFDGASQSTLKSLDCENVIYISSFGKVLSPGYRIGWVAGGKYHMDIERCSENGIFIQNSPCQMAIDSYLASGQMNRHLKTLRRKYRENMSLFRNALCEFFPDDTCICEPEGGLFLWIRLPDGVDSELLTDKAAEQGISIATGMLFSSRGLYRNYIRLNAGIVWSPEVKKALSLLGLIVKKLKLKE